MLSWHPPMILHIRPVVIRFTIVAVKLVAALLCAIDLYSQVFKQSTLTTTLLTTIEKLWGFHICLSKSIIVLSATLW